MRGAPFIEACQKAGVDAFFGVPCSFLADAFAVLEAPDFGAFWPAAREDLAMGAAVGAALAGRTPAVLMQNSGLGVGLNAIGSLLQLYGIPCLLVVSWRGEPTAGFTDAPEHVAAGAQMLQLLKLCGIPVFFLDSAQQTQAVREAVTHSQTHQMPVALVVRRGLLDGSAPGAAPPLSTPRSHPHSATGWAANGGGDAMQGHTAPSVDVCMASIVRRFPEALVVASNGLVSREVYAANDRPQNFYMLGSMGLAPSIALGVALCAPKRPVVVLEGDGNALMGLGNLPMVGQARPRNLWHILLDNGAHRSTGNQRTAGSTVDFAALALACGYGHAAHSAEGPSLQGDIATFLNQKGPGLLAIRCGSERSHASRVRLTPAEITQRTRAALSTR